MNPVVDSLIGSCLARYGLQGALEDSAVFHEERQMPPLILEQAQVLERIAIDRNEVGERTGRDRPEPARLSQDLRIDERGRSQHHTRLLHPRADLQLLGLVSVKLSQQISAKAQLHAGIRGNLDALQSC